MPLFGHWSWPLSEIGTFEKVLQRITQVEVETPWAKKIPRAVWRGTTHFNPLGNPRLRPNLLAAARGKPWADVESLSSEQPLRIEDFCKYKYIIYTEVGPKAFGVAR